MMSKDKDNVCKSEIKNFLTLTSLKGVGRAIKTDEVWLRSVWVAAVIVFLCITMYNVYTLTHQYFMVRHFFHSIRLIQINGPKLLGFRMSLTWREQDLISTSN